MLERTSGQILKSHIQAKSLKYKTLATEVGLEARTINQIVNGWAYPDDKTAEKLADTLGMDAADRTEYLTALARDKAQARIKRQRKGQRKRHATPTQSLAPRETLDIETPEQQIEDLAHHLAARVVEELDRVVDALPEPTGVAEPYRRQPLWRARRNQVMMGIALLILAGMTAGWFWPPITAGGRANMRTSGESFMPNRAVETLCPGVSRLCVTEVGFIQGKVHMICWQDAIWTDNYIHRWFFVEDDQGDAGFVHSGAVADQITTPICTAIPRMTAAAWALTQDNKTRIPDYAQNSNQTTYWSASSWLLAYDSWRLGPGYVPLDTTATTTAQEVWATYKAAGLAHAPSPSPPRGALVLFADGNSVKAAVSLGGGWVEITQGDDSATIAPLPVTHTPIALVNLPQLGYIPPGLIYPA